jgi:predicted membrane channel-forming protein YqfA (hemolysin III family)
MMDGIGSLIVVAWVGLAWLTHVITCISAGKWIFLLAGAVFFPIGCVHGTGIWFGVF